MSAILKMLEASRGLQDEMEEMDGPVAETYRETAMSLVIAYPEIIKLISWVESAEHNTECAKWKNWADAPREFEYGNDCTCGLDEIQSLLRS